MPFPPWLPARTAVLASTKEATVPHLLWPTQQCTRRAFLFQYSYFTAAELCTVGLCRDSFARSSWKGHFHHVPLLYPTMLRYLLHVGLRKGVRVSTEETPREAVVGSHCFLMLTSHHLSVSLSSDPPESIRRGESHHSHFTDGKPAAPACRLARAPTAGRNAAVSNENENKRRPRTKRLFGCFLLQKRKRYFQVGVIICVLKRLHTTRETEITF